MFSLFQCILVNLLHLESVSNLLLEVQHIQTMGGENTSRQFMYCKCFFILIIERIVSFRINYKSAFLSRCISIQLTRINNKTQHIIYMTYN